MAKAKGKAADGATKKTKKQPKESYLKDNFVQINESKVGNSTLITRAMYIRDKGVQVETIALNSKGEVTSMVSYPIEGVKVKTKKDWKYLIPLKEK